MNKKIVTNQDSINKTMDEYFNDPKIQAEVAYATGHFDAIECAIKAHEMGEMEQFVEWMTPKTSEEWDEVIEKYGENYSERWMSEQQIKQLHSDNHQIS